MELSSRDKRILAEIECESALEDPKWVRRFERLGNRGRRLARRRAGYALAVACWVALLVVGAVTGPQALLWAAVAIAPVAVAAWVVRRMVRRARRRGVRRISRIPRQHRTRRNGWSIPDADGT